MRTGTLVKPLAVCAVVAAGLILPWSSSTEPAHAADVVQVTTGFAHSCALLGDGTVQCWGSNSDGQLGDGTTIDRTTPVNVSGLTGVASIAAGERYTCAVTTAGGTKCWGDNEFGQLGDGTTTSRTTPVNVSSLTSGVASVAAGGVHTCAVTTAGGAKCWGLNITGQLGDGQACGITCTTPVDVSGLTSGVAAIAAGGFLFWGHSCAATTAGGAKCWGDNGFGQLGDGTTIGRLAPADVLKAPLGSPITSIANVTTGVEHTCARTGGGGAKCWGSNGSGQLGDGTTTNRTTPVDVSGLTGGVASVAAGTLHTCAVTTTGGAKCWGSNNDGKLGDGTTTNRTTPVDVSGLTSGVAAIAGGGTHSCAVTTGGSVRCWGSNSNGQLGDGTNSNSTTPVSVSGLEKPPVGGIAELPEVARAPAGAPDGSDVSVALLIGIAAAAVLALGAAWYVWRRPG